VRDDDEEIVQDGVLLRDLVGKANTFELRLRSALVRRSSCSMTKTPERMCCCLSNCYATINTYVTRSIRDRSTLTFRNRSRSDRSLSKVRVRALVGGHAASFDVEFDLLDYATVQVHATPANAMLVCFLGSVRIDDKNAPKPGSRVAMPRAPDAANRAIWSGVYCFIVSMSLQCLFVSTLLGAEMFIFVSVAFSPWRSQAAS
jgi:hypothetical protein